MAIPTTRSWLSGEILTASNLIRHVNNLLNSLAGRIGVVQIENSLEVASGDNGNNYFRLPGGTSTQRPGIPAEGMIRYNSTLARVEYYNGSAWRSV